MAQGKLIKIRVNPAAKKVLEQAAKDLGWKQEAVASKIFMWWSAQPQDVREAILGMVPASCAEELAALIMERISLAMRERGKHQNK